MVNLLLSLSLADWRCQRAGISYLYWNVGSCLRIQCQTLQRIGDINCRKVGAVPSTVSIWRACARVSRVVRKRKHFKCIVFVCGCLGPARGVSVLHCIHVFRAVRRARFRKGMHFVVFFHNRGSLVLLLVHFSIIGHCGPLLMSTIRVGHQSRPRKRHPESKNTF